MKHKQTFSSVNKKETKESKNQELSVHSLIVRNE